MMGSASVEHDVDKLWNSKYNFEVCSEHSFVHLTGIQTEKNQVLL